MKFSNYQNEIFKAVEKGNSNIVIKATAGSGKTTTLVECSKRISPLKKMLFLAFNKSIVTELKPKLQKQIDCSTMHSKGLKQLFPYYGKIKINDLKSLTFSEQFVRPMKMPSKEKFVFQLKVDEILKYTRMCMLEDYSKENVLDICDTYGLSIEDEVVTTAVSVWKEMNSYNLKKGHKNFLVDFVDMVYLPASLPDIRVETYDFVMIDECQDLNRSDIALMERLIKKGGRTIAVGDPNQMIYMFAGADSKAYETLTKRDNTINLPLTVSYRCAKNIVEKAKEVCEDIEAHSGAEDGTVRDGLRTEIQEGDLVVCRNTVPLIQLCTELISSGVKAVVVGREFEKKLKSFLNKYQDFPLERVNEKACDELIKIEDNLIKRGVSKFMNHATYRSTAERNEVIDILSRGSNNTSELVERVDEIFDDSKQAVKLMTIHRAKGLESDRVFFLQENLIPSPFAESPEEHIQENNLKFVAITRAKKELIYVD